MFCTAAVLAVALFCCAVQARSDYPNRPVRLITPFNPGGAIDIYSRTAADPLGKRLGQNIVASGGDPACVAFNAADADVRLEAGQELLEGSPA